MTYSSDFKREFSFQKRCAESSRILLKYPDRVPIICEKSNGQLDLPDLDKKKFLVPLDFTMRQFILVIRKRMNLRHDEAVFLFVKDQIFTGAAIVGNVYKYLKDDDGFLYIQYAKESTFGH